MEKFGIFELLDTLSALILPDGQAGNAKERPQSAPDPPRAGDRAFAPPAYDGENATPASPAPAAEPRPAASALSSFLEKHDSAVKRIDPAPNGGKR